MTSLVDHEFGDPLVQLAVGAAENHLQHVSIHLLHHHVDLERHTEPSLSLSLYSFTDSLSLSHTHRNYAISLPHTYPLRSLKHLLKVDDPGVTEILEDGDLCSQLTLMFVGESQFVNDLHCHWFGCVSVLTCTGGREEREERQVKKMR